MREGWESVPLGKLVSQVKEKFTVDASDTYMSLGLRMYGKGVFARDPKLGSAIKGTTLYRVRAGQFIYNRMFAAGGSFGVVPPDLAGGVVSNEFPVFDADAAQLLTAYLDLYFQQPSVWTQVELECTGTTQSRNRWKEEDLRAFQFPLPPLSEQRRIVDLIGALDEAIEAADENLERVRNALGEVREAQLTLFPLIQAADIILDISSGRSPAAKNSPPSLEEFGVLKVSAIGNFGFRPEEAKTISDVSIFSDEMRVRANDVLISRANTAERVGMICLVDEDFDNLFLCDKTLRITPKVGVDPACLVAVFQSSGARTQLSSSGTGTSGSMKNISQEDIRRVSIQWPGDEPAQLRFAALIGSHQATVNATRGYAASLRTLRSNLLTVLLSGEHEIPASYDALIEVAA
jgi:type I restriction enzyme S subunit